MIDELLRQTLKAHYALPVTLRAWVIAPATVVFVAITGLLFTLPPGPLSDEGMILFMEGGCDWGESNVFFFSKLGLLVATNAVFIRAWMAGVERVIAFAPHFAVLVAVTLANLPGGRCDTYYSHPNGSIGQMTLESIAFGVLGCVLLHAFTRRLLSRLLFVLLAWNAFHIAVFYATLSIANHWTWRHTFAVVTNLLLASAAVGAWTWQMRRITA